MNENITNESHYLAALRFSRFKKIVTCMLILFSHLKLNVHVAMRMI